MKLINKTHKTYKTESKEIQEKYYIDKGKRLSVYALACGYIHTMETVETVPYEVVICTPSFMSVRPKYSIDLAYHGTYVVIFRIESGNGSVWYYRTRKEAEQNFRRLCEYVKKLKE